MVHVLVRHKVQDYNRWRAAFDEALLMRRTAGEISSRVFRNHDNGNEVSLLCDFDSFDHARDYLDSEELEIAMRMAGVVDKPRVEYLYEAVTMRRTAAD